ncbi:DUF2156 domain-containing protein [archaeon]|nr:DUF2156 domain-containing protein [archaeon]
MGNAAEKRTVPDVPDNVVSLAPYQNRTRGGVDLFTFEERIAYIRKYGDQSMSFSTLQPGMHYFDVPGLGFMAFRDKWGYRLTLCDPVCDVKDREVVLRELINNDKKQILFVQLSQDTAELLHRRFGLYATQFGSEIIVDLENWSLKGKKKQILRTAVNHARKEGVVIEENCSREECRRLTDEWLNTRKVRNREIGFLIRPMEMDYEEGTRKFFAYLDGELIGFIYFDPLYSDNRVMGYVPNISRFSSRFKPGIFYPIMVHAMEVFKQEGIKTMNLGLCPLVIDDRDYPSESALQKKINRLIYRYGNWVFSFKGLYFTKSRFEGIERKVFGAHEGMLPTLPFLTMFKLCNFM